MGTVAKICNCCTQVKLVWVLHSVCYVWHLRFCKPDSNTKMSPVLRYTLAYIKVLAYVCNMATFLNWNIYSYVKIHQLFIIMKIRYLHLVNAVY